jgi:hypothetical protein
MASPAGSRERRVARAFEEAVVLMRHGSYGEAARRFRAALRLAPHDPDLHYNLGVALAGMGEHPEAIASLRRALALDPESADAQVGIGDSLQALWRHAESLGHYAQALSVRPDLPEAHNNYGNALQAIGRYAEAVEHYHEALRARPGYTVCHINLGNAMRALGRDAEALACYRRAQELEPDGADAQYYEAVARLRAGDYEAGWRAYQHRWRRTGFPDRLRETGALWLGRENLAGKTILLYAEQGLGDTLQFVRYVPLVAARGAKVVLEVQPVLVPVLGAFRGVAEVIPRGAPLPEMDFQCPVMSLPLAFGTNLQSVPASVPYLSVAAERIAHWRTRLATGGDRLVGLAWRGNPAHDHGPTRDIAIRLLEPLLRVPGFRFVSLQKELTREEQKWLQGFPGILHVGADFAPTAEMVGALDLVISVDSAWVHWAGAIAKPVWVLLASETQSDWRWMTRREDSPWYPTARLFRQPAFGDWPGAIARAAGALAQLAPR